jgi:hypothetical protein
MSEAKQVMLRCPGCSREVAMPAESCPACGFNFRDGRPPAPPTLQTSPLHDETGRRSIWYLAAAAGVMLLIAVGYMVFGSDDDPPDVTGAPPPAAGSILAPVPVNPPPLAPISPAKTIGNARDQADHIEERQRLAQELVDSE